MWVTFLSKQAVGAASPLVLAGLGELVAQKAGVINVGIEGLMLVGCLAAYAGAGASGSGMEGVLAAAGAGAALAMVFALATVFLRADQIVTGTAVNLLAVGIVGTAWRWVEARFPVLPAGAGFEVAPIPRLAGLPLVGPVFFQQFGLTYALGALAVVVWAVLRFTRGGLVIRALGDSPEACDAAGISVRWARAGCVVFAGALAGMAGAYLSIMRTHSFTTGATGGRGFLVLALVIFGRWNVWGLVAGCFLFGGVEALEQYWQAGPPPAWLSLHAFGMLPYVATLVALAVLTRHRKGPAFLGKPWPEG